jgi:hypothetical protein
VVIGGDQEATITANPNPVLFTWPRLVVAGTSTMTTTVTWDADSNAQGEVFVTRDGGQTEQKIAGGPQLGSRRGTTEAEIELGETLEFRLKRADNNVVLATVTVTTTETPGLPLAVPDALRNWGNDAAPHFRIGCTAPPSGASVGATPTAPERMEPASPQHRSTRECPLSSSPNPRAKKRQRS